MSAQAGPEGQKVDTDCGLSPIKRHTNTSWNSFRRPRRWNPKISLMVDSITAIYFMSNFNAIGPTGKRCSKTTIALLCNFRSNQAILVLSFSAEYTRRLRKRNKLRKLIAQNEFLWPSRLRIKYRVSVNPEHLWNLCRMIAKDLDDRKKILLVR